MRGNLKGRAIILDSNYEDDKNDRIAFSSVDTDYNNDGVKYFQVYHFRNNNDYAKIL